MSCERRANRAAPQFWLKPVNNILHCQQHHPHQQHNAILAWKNFSYKLVIIQQHFQTCQMENSKIFKRYQMKLPEKVEEMLNLYLFTFLVWCLLLKLCIQLNNIFKDYEMSNWLAEIVQLRYVGISYYCAI